MCCHCPEWKMFWCESNDWWAWTAHWLSALNCGGGGGSYSTDFLTLHWNVFWFGKAKSFTLVFTGQLQHLQGLSLRDHCACIIRRQQYVGKYKSNRGHSQSIKMSHLDKSASLLSQNVLCLELCSPSFPVAWVQSVCHLGSVTFGSSLVAQGL